MPASTDLTHQTMISPKMVTQKTRCVPQAHSKYVHTTCSNSLHLAWQKQPKGHGTTTGFPTKWHLRNDYRNSILNCMIYASLSRSGQYYWLAEANFSGSMTNKKHYPDLGSNSSLIQNFCICFSDIICIGNSMICSDIWHKYHEWYFKIVIRNFTSR